MSIVSSSILASDIQADGRFAVHEAHVDNLNIVYDIFYLADAQLDKNATLAVHATNLAISIQNSEIDYNVNQVTLNGSLASITFNYSTQAQNLAALRLAYQSSTRVQAIMIGDFLSSLTNAQLQNIFSMTSGQVTTLRTNKLTPAVTSAAAIRAAAGQ